MSSGFFTGRGEARAYFAFLPTLLALLCFVSGAVFYLLPGSSFLGLFLAAAGLALLTLAGLNRLCGHARWRRTAVFMRGLLTLGAILFLASFIIVEGMLISGGRKAPDTRAQYAVVFGAGLNGETPSLALLSRLRAAQDWLEENPASVVVVTGARGPGESITEAQAMRIYLESKGISSARILTEEKARDTEQNARYSAEILHELIKTGAVPASDVRVAVITNEFHIFRASRLIKEQGFEPVAVPSPTPYAYLKAAYYVREYFSVVFMRLGL